LTVRSFIEKETIEKIIFRTTKIRNRLMLESMARGGMRIGADAIGADGRFLSYRNSVQGISDWF
jgi:hypothetical protein